MPSIRGIDSSRKMNVSERRGTVSFSSDEEGVEQQIPSHPTANRPSLHGVMKETSADLSASKQPKKKKREEKVVTMRSGLQSSVQSGRVDMKSAFRDLSEKGALKKRKQDLLKKEELAREQEQTNAVILMVVNTVAAFKVFLYYLITLETLFSAALSVGLTVFWYRHRKDDLEWSASAMDWILLGFAVVLPLSISIGLAFRRRENALLHVTNFRSFSYQIYVAHCIWDWEKGNGRLATHIDWVDHTDQVLKQLCAIGDEISRFLTLPTSSRIRHRLTSSGRKEAARTMEVSYALFESVCTKRVLLLSILCEKLKAAGLSSSEVSRIRQYERFIGMTLEGLRMIKMYRTPQALLAFSRLFVLFLPPFYAPTFAQIAIDMDSLGIGICFAVLAAIGLSALYESIQVLEDPFVAFITLDGIDIREELEVLHYHQLIKARELIFPDADEYKDENVDEPLSVRDLMDDTKEKDSDGSSPEEEEKYAPVQQRRPAFDRGIARSASVFGVLVMGQDKKIVPRRGSDRRKSAFAQYLESDDEDP